MNSLIQLKQTTSVFLLALAWFVFLPQMQSAPDVLPPPDGCYPGFTTAEGCNALKSLTTGAGNTGVGWDSLSSNTTGSYNTAVGAGALVLNTGSSNTAVGTVALLLNTSGTNNTAVGTDALVYNSTGGDNTAVGAFALENNAGDHNTATGDQALSSNTTGSENTANGVDALAFNTTGTENTGIGFNALLNNAEGGANTAIGFNALAGTTLLASNNTAIGWGALANNTTGSDNVAVGVSAGAKVVTATNAICIGTQGADVSTSCFIGNIIGIEEGGQIFAVYINSDGRLGTQPPPSSCRFKKDIKPIDNASQAILALKPVTFHYNSDKTNRPEFGLIAEEVAKVNPALVLPDKEGRPYSVRYDAVNAMLLNEFLKEHRKVQKLEATVTQQQENFQSKLAKQEEQIAALTAGLQQVSAQLEVSKSAPQTVLNSQ